MIPEIVWLSWRSTRHAAVLTGSACKDRLWLTILTIAHSVHNTACRNYPKCLILISIRKCRFWSMKWLWKSMRIMIRSCILEQACTPSTCTMHIGIIFEGLLHQWSLCIPFWGVCSHVHKWYKEWESLLREHRSECQKYILNSASALLTASTRRRAHGIFISSYATMGMEQSLSTTSSGGAAVFFNPILYNRDVLD